MFSAPSGFGLNDIISQQYNREQNLIENCMSHFQSCICVIGLGGIGGHLAEILGSLSTTKSMILIDPDTVELSNLNRTCYKYNHIDKYKVVASAEIISSRNIRTRIVPLAIPLNNENQELIRNTVDYLPTSNGYWTIFDARDNFFDDYNLIRKIFDNGNIYKSEIVRAAYNGMSITIDINPEDHPVWGDPTAGYTTIPSHAIPSRLVALLCIIFYAMKHNKSKLNKSTLEKLLSDPLTINIGDIIPYLYLGNLISKNNIDLNTLMSCLNEAIEKTKNIPTEKR